MNYEKLKQNIIDVITEEQLKLGYRSEMIRLYYPLSSLERLLGINVGASEKADESANASERAKERRIARIHEMLTGFTVFAADDLGVIEVSNREERFCFAIPPQGVDFVHDHQNGTEFIADFIRTVSRHGSTLDDVLAQFYKHSDRVHVEKTKHGEFDYLVYFEDGVPDNFRYCITDEGCHIIYHRFTAGDYEEFGF